MKYRAEIDGLRALAVVPVILFHAGFELFRGGFVGVDVFFVISGYLITTILIEDIEKKRFSIVKFYERRALRILPALFFVMLVCIPFAWMWMLPSQMEDFSRSLIAVSLFVSNILFWRESGYFDAVAEEKPLLHTWSLAVEEQYYFLFPIFLILVWRFGKNRVFWMIVVMATISLLMSEWGSRNRPTANFYLALTRAWELLAGSIAAFVVQKNGVQKSNTLALLGLAVIIFSIFVYDESTPFPSVYALLPVFGVVLLVLYADRETYAAKLLSTKAFVGIGLISYSAYLWHQPLFAFARIRLFEHPSPTLMLVLSIMSIALAYFSWRYIEKPFRNSLSFPRKHIFLISAAGLIFFISVGLSGHFKQGYPNRLPGDLGLTLNSIDDIKLRLGGNGCHLSTTIPMQPLPPCGVNLHNDNSNILLIGDSHLDAIGLQLLKQLEKLNLSAYALSYSSCVPFSGLNLNNQDSSFKCSEYNEILREYARTHGVKTIILVARFPLYLLGSRYDNGEGGVEGDDPAPVDLLDAINNHKKSDDVSRIARVAEKYRTDIEDLTKHFNVIVFSPIPEVGWNVPSYYSKRVMFDANAASFGDLMITHSYDNYLARTEKFRNILNSIESNNLHVYNVHSLFCNEESRRCNANVGTNFLYRDDNHLTPYAAEIVAQDFIRQFQKILSE